MATYTSFSSSTTFSGQTKESAVPIDRNNTDIIAPEFRLYVEGVQIPFESISISQQYANRPSADIQIPAESGLLDIIRGYEPKVHIFYNDVNYGGDRLLFWGVIKSVAYARSRSQGSTYITFHCEHKNEILTQVTMDFTGWASPYMESISASDTNQATIKPDAFNSTAMVVEAMAGIEGVVEDTGADVADGSTQGITPDNTNIANANVKLLPENLKPMKDRLTGMVGVSVNLWNQIKKAAYTKNKQVPVMSKMYAPLIDEGIAFFKRTSGHPTLEAKLQTSKQTYCNHRINQETKINVPPSFRNPMISAIQTETTVRALSNMVGFSGEMITFDDLLKKFYYTSEYDILTLASPAEINLKPSVYIDEVNKTGVEKVAIETIIKPKVPFYYAPTCNVILPRMYSSIQLNQDEGRVPTRLTALHDAIPGSQGTTSASTSFKGPASYREAVAYAFTANNVIITSKDLDIGSTKGNSFFVPGKYELGMGIRHERISLPWWLSLLYADKHVQGDKNQESRPATGTNEDNMLRFAEAEWDSRYSETIKEDDGDITESSNFTKKGLNPYNRDNPSISPHERILFPTMDYEYSQRIANSRGGVIEGIFNPYIIPGYPMDVIDENPNYPSFHAFCTSVTHNITSRGVSTTIGMINVVSYAELSNYYIPPLPPFLQTALLMLNGELTTSTSNNVNEPTSVKSTNSLLVQNPIAKNAADTFYREVLGVGAAAPDDLIHFVSNRAYPLERRAGILLPKIQPDISSTPNNKPTKIDKISGRQTDDYYSSVGNLRLVRRPIESKESIAKKFSYNFIDLDRKLYNDSYINYVNPKLTTKFYAEPGSSLFLDYMEIEDFLKL